MIKVGLINLFSLSRKASAEDFSYDELTQIHIRIISTPFRIAVYLLIAILFIAIVTGQYTYAALAMGFLILYTVGLNAVLDELLKRI